MPALLLLALLVVPLVEIYVLVQVGQQIGALPTIVLLVVVSLVGAALLRREGARTWRAFRDATAAGRVPAREVADGALVLFGGALLLTPGFLSDLIGLLCVLPPSRALLRRALLSYVTRRTLAAAAGPQSRRSGSRPRRSSSGRVVEGEVVQPPDDPPAPPTGSG